MDEIQWTAYCAPGESLAAEVELAFAHQDKIGLHESGALMAPDIILVNEKALRQPPEIEFPASFRVEPGREYRLSVLHHVPLPEPMALIGLY